MSELEKFNAVLRKVLSVPREELSFTGEFGEGQPLAYKEYILAHKHCSKHRSELEKSSLCGCFYCLAIFPPSDIVEWIDDGQTALCPKCPVDSVIGSASGYPITAEFLQGMHDHWF